MNYSATINSDFVANYGTKELRQRILRIRILRGAMLAIGAISALLFFGFAIVSVFANKSNPTKELVNGDAVVLSKPRFIGHSSSGGKITITAERATRAVGNDEGVVALELPHMVSEEGADVSAKTGVWDQNNQVLRLKDEVVMVYPTGDKVHSNDAYWGPDSPNTPMAKKQNDISIKEASVGAPSRLWLIGKVHFTRPTGETIDGENAIWDGKAGRLSLSGNVLVSMKNGNATSQSLLLETHSRIVRGGGGVSIALPMGTGSAQSYEYYPDSNRLILRGAARIVFNK